MRSFSYAERRRLVDYIHATENEIAIDVVALELAGVTPERCGYFPRVSKWVTYTAKWRGQLRLLWLIAAPAWRLGGAAAYHLLECLRFQLRAGRHRAREARAHLDSQPGHVLAFSSRVTEIVRPPGIPHAPASWLTLPGVRVDATPGRTVTSMFALVTPSELWRCWYRASVIAHVLGRRSRTRRWVLQSYTAFRWFAVRTALEAISGDLLMTQHFDRWAVLVDRVVLAKRRARGSRVPVLTLVQHGEIGSLSPLEWRKRFFARLRWKLQSVSVLCAYDAASAEIFRTDLLSASCARALHVNYYQPSSIVLRSLAPRTGCRVLFVGHPVCEALHIHVLASLIHEKPLQVFYKPHPKARMGPRVAEQAWSIVKGADVFPAVELLISYPSTLVAEYAVHGVPAVVHPLDLTLANAQEFVEEVRNRVRALAA